MNELSQKILLECREEVAKEYGFADWKECFLSCHWTAKNDKVIEESALLAMDRQAEFLYWTINNGWKKIPNEGRFWNKGINSEPTELELYRIWREGK